MNPENRILVTGLHRSGTTWLGKAMAQHEDCTVLHEPLNFGFGVNSVPGWYPAAESLTERAQISRLVDDIVSGRARYKTTRRESDSPLKALLRKISGGPDNLAYRRAIKRKARNLVLKDPFCMRLALLLAREHGFRGIILMRHPAAWLTSLKRMGWDIPADVFPDLPMQSPASRTKIGFAHDVGLFWRKMYEYATIEEKSSEGNLKIFRHEDLCVEPVQTGVRVFSHVGLTMTDTVKRFLQETTSGEIETPDNGVLHSMTRNAAALAQSLSLIHI